MFIIVILPLYPISLEIHTLYIYYILLYIYIIINIANFSIICNQIKNKYMNSSMIKLKELTTITNTLVIEFAESYYNRKLSKAETNAFMSMDLVDKEWLIKQYKEEVMYNTLPDFEI